MLALTRQTTRGIAVSAETMRRWLHEIGWVWKPPKLATKDDDPSVSLGWLGSAGCASRPSLLRPWASPMHWIGRGARPCRNAREACHIW
jgi:hypothetical protein